MSTDTLTMNAVGDICLGDSLISLGFGVRSTIEQQGNDFIFAPIREKLRDADILFGNLECVLSDQGYGLNPKTRYLRGSPDAVGTVLDGGFDLLNIANNHTLQYGTDAFNETVGIISSNGIEPLGLRGSDGFHSRPIIISKKDFRVGFLGYSYEWEQYFEGTPLYATGARDNIIEDIDRMSRKGTVDFIIVSLHWGLEYMTHPSREMVELAHELIDHGCHVVLGRHPHVLQGHEIYKHGAIAYSLGNFVFDKMWWPTCRKSSVARLTFSRTPAKKVTLEMLPVHINDKFQPELLEGPEKDSVLNWLNTLNKPATSGPFSVLVNYKTTQKLKLQALNGTKFVHIMKNFFRYEPHIRSFLLRDKILRLR